MRNKRKPAVRGARLVRERGQGGRTDTRQRLKQVERTTYSGDVVVAPAAAVDSCDPLLERDFGRAFPLLRLACAMRIPK